jgi:periplasmic protein TonB
LALHLRFGLYFQNIKMANEESHYSRHKYRKKYDLLLGYLFALGVLLFLLGLMYLASPHDEYYSTAMEMQMPVEMGKVEDMMQAKLLQQSTPPEGLTQPTISLVDEIAAKVIENINARQDTLIKRDNDTLNSKLTGGGGADSKAEADVEDPTPFQIVEEKPLYPGGIESLTKFLETNIKYPHVAKEAGIMGTVIVQFIIQKDGSVGEVKVVRGLGGGCNEEAVRVVSMMPKWTPGRQRGKAVRVTFHIPVIFNLRAN